MPPALNTHLTRSFRWRGGASANDELGGQRDRLIDVIASEQAENDVRGAGALLVHGLADRGQVGEFGQRVVVDADDGDVFRYSEAGPS